MKRIMAVFLAVFLGLAAAGQAQAALVDYNFNGSLWGAIDNNPVDLVNGPFIDIANGSSYRIHLSVDPALVSSTPVIDPFDPADPSLNYTYSFVNVAPGTAWIDIVKIALGPNPGDPVVDFGRGYFTDPLMLTSVVGIDGRSTLSFGPQSASNSFLTLFSSGPGFDLANPNGGLPLYPSVLADQGTFFDMGFVPIVRGTTPFLLTVDSATVPEPGSMLLLGAGLVGLAGLRRRRSP